MKKIILFIICIFIPLGFYAQNLIGAWVNESISQHDEKLKNILLFADGYQVFTTYNAATGAFVETSWGTWKLKEQCITQITEFDTENSDKVGTEKSFNLVFNNDESEITYNGINFKRIDSGAPGKLQGAWLMSQRLGNGETSVRDMNDPRKTMKILSGTRFQWIAYNTETKKFMDTGGGTYTTINGEYTENIKFFSKDDSKVGLSLKFNFEIRDGKWIHKGFSSKGDPIHEVWNKRQ